MFAPFLSMFRRSFVRRSRAFTLIELLVVIVILGILMAVAVPTFLRQQSKAQDSRTQQYLTTAYKAIRAGTPDTGNVYPSSTSMVSWITQSEPELTAQRGDCLNGVANAQPDVVLVDPSSSANSLTLCSQSKSGNVWKLTATATSAPTLLNGTLVPFSFSGGEITDAVRTTATSGDGLAPESSTGTWEGTANLVSYNSFETGNPLSNNWGNNQGSLTQDTTRAKFGTGSGKFVSSGGSASGPYFANPTKIPVTVGNTYTVSGWVTSQTAMSAGIRAQINWYDSGGSVISTSNGPITTVPVGSWTRLVETATAPAGAVGALLYFQGTLASGDTFWLDGVQFEQTFIATPYTPTSRAGANITVSASLLNVSQGWAAVRMRLDWAATSPPRGGLGWDWWFKWGQGTAPSRYSIDGLYRETGAPNNDLFDIESWNGPSSAGAETPSGLTFSAGSIHTVIIYWTATTLGISYDGSTFYTGPRSTGVMPAAQMPATFTVGSAASGSQIDGEIFWFACGQGTLTNADAATINSWGNTDPRRASFPTAAQTSMVWDGTSTSGSLK